MAADCLRAAGHHRSQPEPWTDLHRPPVSTHYPSPFPEMVVKGRSRPGPCLPELRRWRLEEPFCAKWRYNAAISFTEAHDAQERFRQTGQQSFFGRWR